MVYCSPSGSKSPQLSRTLLGILADLNSAVVWPILILPRILVLQFSFIGSLRLFLWLTLLKSSSLITFKKFSLVSSRYFMNFMLFFSIQVFHTSFKWFFLICATARLLRSSSIFLVFSFNSTVFKIVLIFLLMSNFPNFFSYKGWYAIKPKQTLSSSNLNLLYSCL